MEVVLSYDRMWTCRSITGLPFYTLGAASYLDARWGEAAYITKAQEQNITLVTRLRHFYQLLLSQLGIILQEPCFYDDDAKALPGFHIFKSHPDFTKDDVASIHSDKQYQLLKWTGLIEDTFSFTLPIELPASGGGLNYWSNKEGPFFWPYKVGTLVYFFGDMVHQIAPFKEFEQDQWRITMQGHGVRINKRWHIYW